MSRVLAPLSLLAVATIGFAADPPLKATPVGAAGAAARWAEQLGDRDFQTRERASKELDTLGDDAVPALERVIASGPPEAVRRAIAVLRRIQTRGENARAIAPKLVDIDLDDKTLGTALGEFEKQTGYRIRVNGDQAVLSKKGTFTAKKEPFWVALDRFAAQAGLEFDSAAGLNVPVNMPRDMLAEQEMRQRQVERDLVQAQIGKAKVLLATLRNQEATIAKKLAGLKDDEKKEKGPALEAELAVLKKQIAVSAAEIDALERKFAAVTTAPPPAGTVVLRAAGSAKVSASVAGAVRIHATPFPGQLPQVSSEVIPLLLTATPEPSLRWVRATEAIITKATAPDGTVITYDPLAGSFAGANATQEEMMMRQMQQLGRRGRIRGEFYVEPTRVDMLGGFAPSGYQSLVRLNAPAKLAVTKLATVEGVVRAKVWGPPEAVASHKGLSAESVRVYGPGGVSLDAKLTVDPNDKAAYFLDVELVYDATEVSPQAGAPSSDPLYLEQGPGGRARPIRPTPRPAIRANPQGLSVADADGNEYGMSLRMSESTSLSYDPFSGNNRLLRLKQQYIVRPSKADAGPPARLTFTAVRMREVDLPFKLTDVPVAAGTMDPKAVVPQPQPWPSYDR